MDINKKRKLIIISIVIGVLLITTTALAKTFITADEGLEIADKMVIDGETLHFSREIVELSLYEYQSNENVYVVDKETGKPYGYFKKEVASDQVDTVISKEEAQKIVIDKLTIVRNDFFDGNQYKVENVDLADAKQYAITINQVSDLGYENGNLILAYISYAGEIMSYEIHENNNSDLANKEILIKKEEAINIAKEQVINDLERFTDSMNATYEDTKPRPADDPEISDNELLTGEKDENTNNSTEIFSCQLDDTAVITAKVTVIKDKLVWMVEIQDIKNSSNIGLGYWIQVDAYTGEIISVKKTK
ncbi:MAG: PepSY domain-containing protein [Eubacteriaceae bacterium]